MRKYLYLLLVLSACGPKAVVQQSPLDTAANHYARGVTHLERGDLLTAQREFERARLLDPDFPGIYVGSALVALGRDDFFRARKEIERALHKGKAFVDAHIALGRIATAEGVALGEAPEKWLPEALRAYKKALALRPDNPQVYFRQGQTYIQARNLPLARQSYTQIVEMNRGPFVAKAMAQIERLQMIERAAPGTDEGIKIGLVETISRAELAVLLIKEMKLAELVDNPGNPYILCLGREEYAFAVQGGLDRDLTATLMREILHKTSTRFNLAAPLTVAEGRLEEVAKVGFAHGADIVVRTEAIAQEAAGIKVAFSQLSLADLGLRSVSLKYG